MKFIFTFLCIVSFAKISMAQLSVGAAYGSFHVRGESNRVSGAGPSLQVEYVDYENEDQQLYLDASFYKKSFDAGETEIYDNSGFFIGDANTLQSYSIKHIELGFKRSLVGDFTDSKFNFFLGAGGALSLVQVTFKYDLPGVKIADDKINKTIYGFHFCAGAQWHIKPVIIELRGSFDFLVKPIEVAGGDNHSYFLTSTKLGITYPLTKKIKRAI